MPATLSPTAQRVQDTLAALGFDYRVTESDHPTRTSAEAARLVGCEVGQIAKSLVFRCTRGGQAVLVIARGASRVDETKTAAVIGEL
jgi:prolyl-tRNA editing enzyme YbaK/EbsC (Cys-tRNA(Pro) deacylase)